MGRMSEEFIRHREAMSMKQDNSEDFYFYEQYRWLHEEIKKNRGNKIRKFLKRIIKSK